jgi:dTDP-4-dehydrorhamnose 3,5-epimerase-like enzyme
VKIARPIDPPHWIERTVFVEENGSVTVVEQATLPFRVQRTFLVEAGNGQIRGHHAHRECWQALFAIDGSVVVVTQHPGGSDQFILTKDGPGIVLPPMIWATQEYLGSPARLLVACSEVFSESDYIRTFEAYLAAVAGNS